MQNVKTLPALLAAAMLTVTTPGCTESQAQTAAPASYGDDTALKDVRARLPEDEIIYFVLPDRFANGDPANDRGGLTGDAMVTGFNPAHKGFYHGGDLKGLTGKLDYLENMGITAIWFAPVFKNKPVQGGAGNESAGYHGYWITDFTSVDPHFGTNAEFRAFVDAAHGRGMKVYMDIITNHTADVIAYRECPDSECTYRGVGEYPYATKGLPSGPAINEEFAGDDVQTAENFAKLTDPNFAYTPFVPEAEKDVKVPAWLNDPIYYHNRGNTNFRGESSRMGDFVGLDDLMTENPRVVDGFIDIYKGWIDEFGIDGFRIDTARHVNPEFWQKFVPAILEKAKASGIPNFHIFGEVYGDGIDPGYLAQFSRRDGFPTLLDFSFQAAVRQALKKGEGTAGFNRLFDGDTLYEGGDAQALRLPTFLGNHDMGRLSTLIKADNPGISQDELLARVTLGHAMMLTLRGVPTIYSGDEQGFVGDGNDQAAREDMFGSKTASYNDNDLIGTDATTADENYDMQHPLYQTIAALSGIRREHAALRRGRQLIRAYGDEPGLFAVSRFDPATDAEYVIMFNTSDQAIAGHVEVGYDSRAFSALYGVCTAEVAAPASLGYALPAFGTAICMAKGK